MLLILCRSLQITSKNKLFSFMTALRDVLLFMVQAQQNTFPNKNVWNNGLCQLKVDVNMLNKQAFASSEGFFKVFNIPTSTFI